MILKDCTVHIIDYYTSQWSDIMILKDCTVHIIDYYTSQMVKFIMSIT